MRAFTTDWHHDAQTTSNWLMAQVLDMLVEVVELAYYSKPVQHLKVLSPISLQISS